MRHFNQRKYSYLPYPQCLDRPDDPYGKNATVRSGGCGLCCACMVVDQLTTEAFSLRQCAELSMAMGANHCDGTDMLLLGPAVAERFHLTFSAAGAMEDALKALHNGGKVIAWVSAQTPGSKGIFTKGGHYITLISADEEDEICILDPSWDSKKYKKWVKEGLVREDGTLVYATPQVLEGERRHGPADFFIFRRK